MDIQTESPTKNLVVIPMRKSFVTCFAIFSLSVEASDAGSPTKSPGPAVTGAVLLLSFAVVFLVLFYLKYCHRIPNNPMERILDDPLNGSMPRSSGFDRAVIDSLPIFKFSSLKGSKQGLQCVVCMSMFQDTELLRLLPKCNHAFHTTCIDRWLESRPTCPLCRYEYDANELSVSDDSDVQNFMQSDSNSLRETDVDIYIEREENLRWSWRFIRGRRKADHGRNLSMLHRFNHTIVIRSLVIKQRWSDLNSLDLLVLSSEMLGASSNESLTQVDLRCEDLDRYYDVRPSNGRRSVSEITVLSRFDNGSGHRDHEYPFERNGESTGNTRNGRLWLPIVHRTMNWLAGRENHGMHRIGDQMDIYAFHS